MTRKIFASAVLILFIAALASAATSTFTFTVYGVDGSTAKGVAVSVYDIKGKYIAGGSTDTGGQVDLSLEDLATYIIIADLESDKVAIFTQFLNSTASTSVTLNASALEHVNVTLPNIEWSYKIYNGENYTTDFGATGPVMIYTNELLNMTFPKEYQEGWNKYVLVNITYGTTAETEKNYVVIDPSNVNEVHVYYKKAGFAIPTLTTEQWMIIGVIVIVVLVIIVYLLKQGKTIRHTIEYKEDKWIGPADE